MRTAVLLLTKRLAGILPTREVAGMSTNEKQMKLSIVEAASLIVSTAIEAARESGLELKMANAPAGDGFVIMLVGVVKEGNKIVVANGSGKSSSDVVANPEVEVVANGSGK